MRQPMLNMRQTATGASPSGPSVSSEYLRLVALGAEAQGLDLRPMFEASAIDPAVLTQRGARVCARAVKRLWGAVVSRLDDPLFPLRLVEGLPFGSGDLLDYLIRSSPTVGAALENAIRFTPLMTNTERMRVVVSGREARIRLLTGPDTPHADELVMGLFGRRSNETFGAYWSLKRICFSREALGPRDVYERICGTQAMFGMPHTEAVVDRELLDQPMEGADPHLNAILNAQAEALLATVVPPPPPRSLVETIERALNDGRRIGDFTLAGLADQLGIGARTLQRRLRAEGLTHRGLVRRLRYDLAVQSLTSAVPQKQIARRLGYSGTGAFRRAFKAWSGVPPAKLRQNGTRPGKRKSNGHAAMG